MTTLELIHAEIDKIPANRWDDLYSMVRVFAETATPPKMVPAEHQDELRMLIEAGIQSGPGIPASEVFSELRALANSLAGSRHEV